MRLGPLMLDLKSTEVDAEEAEMLAHPVTGAVILFSRNIDNADQVRALCESIREKAKRPLLIAVDQEGGRVQRLKDGFSRLPPMRDISQQPDAATRAEQLGWLMASEVRAAGCDISFAPVLDLDYGHSAVIGDRSFGAEPDQVVELAGAFLRGMNRAGMAGTGKHFPGHGYVAADSHTEVPIDERALVDIERTCLSVFRRLHDAIDGIMPAHVIYPAVDDRPAGFSPIWLQTILREQMKFSGCIFSDDLAMEGATVMGDFSSRARAALSAGCDMVLVCNDRPGAIEVLQSLPHRISSEQESRISALCRRDTPGSLAALKASADWQNAQAFLTV